MKKISYHNFSRWFENLPVKWQVINCSMLAASLMPVASAFVVQNKLSQIDELVKEKGRERTELICLLSLDSLIAEDRPALETVLNGLKTLDTGLVNIELHNAQGIMLASWSRVHELDKNAKVIPTILPINYHGQNFGTAKMEWERKFFAAPIVKKSIQNVVLFLIGGSALLMVLLLLMRKHIIKPLEYLDRKVKAIAIHSTPPINHRLIPALEFKNLDKNLDHTAQILSERAESEARIIRADEQVKAANAAAKGKMDFISLMSHEIRTPLGVMLGFGQLLQLSDLSEEDSGYVESINQSGEFLLHIINDILDLSKIEANGIELEPAPMQMSQLCCEVETMMCPSVKGKDVSFSTSCTGLGKDALIGDLHRLKQVLINLVGNSIKFTEKGQITMKTYLVDGESDNTKKRVRFEVSDTGVGMSEEQLNRVFTPFSQANSSISRKFGGTGLGLTISEQLVGLMGGHIEVDSELGVGSTFSFEIDMEVADEPVATKIAVVDQPNKSAGELEHNFSILVAEDEKMNRILVSKVFDKLGYPIEFAIDGDDCIERLKSGEKYDVIFLDLHMPGVGGMEIAKQIRNGEFGEQIKETNLAIMSADVLAAEEGGSIGVDAFIAKPVDFNVLEKFLSQSLHEPVENREEEREQAIEKARQLELNRKNQTSAKCQLNVLVVEDLKQNRNLIGKIFESMGITPQFAKDGIECIEYLQGEPELDAILLDLRMPRMDGYTVARKIRNGELGEALEDIPIAIISAEMLGEDAYKEIGANQFIPKPFNAASLCDFVESVERDNKLALSS